MPSIIDRIRSIGSDYVLVCKAAIGKDCGNGQRGLMRADGTPLLYFPSCYAQNNCFVEVIDIGPSCKTFKTEHAYWQNGLNEGETTFSPEMGDGMHYIDGPYWVIREKLLLPVIFKPDGPQAIGRYVIVQVPHEKDITKLIVTTDRYRDAQYFGTVVSMGDFVYESFEEGDRILIPKDIFTFEVNGKHYSAIAEDAILGVEEK